MEPRDLETFIPTFAPSIYYMEVAKAHEINNPEEMIEFASKWFKAAPDAKLSGVFYYCGKVADQLGDPPASLNPAVVGDYCTVSRSTLSGTQTGPLPDGQPPTNKPFSLELAEFITYRENPPARAASPRRGRQREAQCTSTSSPWGTSLASPTRPASGAR